MSIFEKYKSRYDQKQIEEISVSEYLDRCKQDPSTFAEAPERLLKAIGDPVVVDTSKDERLSRIFLNRKVKTYPTAFGDFYGIEDVIENIVAFFKHAAQGLEEARNILYLLGPVGSSKSSLSERLKELMQREPIYSIKAFNHARGVEEISPIYESPLGLFDYHDDGPSLEKEYRIPKRYAKYIMSPWASKRLREVNGDLSQFKVVKLWPSILQQIGITKVEPSDENNQDVSSLVGKINIRELENFSSSDPDAYNWAGGLNVTTQGLMEFVELFKSSPKTLLPLLTATQERHYNGTEQFGAIPYQGIILAHSNEQEWQSFRNDPKNEAFIDRVSIVKVPYCLRVSEEVKIYEKLIKNSDLRGAPIAPGTLELMAQYSILTRIKEPENSNPFTKMEIYDGKMMKNKDPRGKSIEEYRDHAGINEGMDGSSTRFAYKILSKTFNYDPDELAASPVHLMLLLDRQIKQEQLPKDEEERRIAFIKGTLAPKYAEQLQQTIQSAYLESYDSYAQNLFEKYVMFAGQWIEDKEYRDTDTGEMYDKDALNNELEKYEKSAGISNNKEFRNEVVMFVLRAKNKNNGVHPKWNSYEKMAEVIEKKLFVSTEDLLPIISFSKKATSEDEKKHNDFVQRMVEKGHTEKQVRTLIEWYMRWHRSN